MRNNTLVMLGASAAFGILAVILARGWIHSAMEEEFRAIPAVMPSAAAPAYAAPETQPVLVAAHDLAFGDTLSLESFRVVDYPEDAVPLDTFASAGELFGAVPPGQPLRALSDIRANEPVFAQRISGPGARLSLSARIRDGYVAAGVAVDPVSGVGGHVVPGDLVDVMHVTQPDPDDAPDLFTTAILIQAVRVLGVDQNALTDTEAAVVARTVTLEVDRRDLQVLALAEETGMIRLGLRAAGETAFAAAPALRSDQLARARAVSVAPSSPAPKRAPQTKAPTDDGRTRIRVVRGDAVKSVRVRRDEAVQSADTSATLAGGQ